MFSRTLDVNIRGTMLCMRAVSKAMAAQEPLTYESRRYGTRSLGRGSIVNLGSVSSYVAAPGMMPYTASKHATIGITKTAGMSYLTLSFGHCLILIPRSGLPASFAPSTLMLIGMYCFSSRLAVLQHPCQFRLSCLGGYANDAGKP